MKKSLLNFSIVLLLVLIVSSVNAQTRTATTSGNWDNVATWGGASVPTSANDVVINNGVTVTVNVAAVCKSITFGNTTATAAVVSVNAGITLNVITSVTLPDAAAISTMATITGAGSLTCASISVGGNITAVTAAATTILSSGIANLSVAGTITVNAENENGFENAATFSLTTGTLTLAGNFYMDSETDGNNATAAFTMDLGSRNAILVLTHATPFQFSGVGPKNITFGSDGANTTVNYAGAAQTVHRNTTYRNLILSGSGVKTTISVGVNDKLSIQGTATVGNPISYLTAKLEYKGNSAQVTSDNEFPSSSGIDEIIIDNPAGITLNGPKSVGGNLTLVSGVLIAGTNLSMSNNNTLTRNEGSMTGIPQGTGDYNVAYTGNSKTTGPELSGTELNNVSVNLTAGQTLALDQSRAPDGGLFVNSGIFDLSTFTIDRSAPGSSALSVSNGATLKIGGTNSLPLNYVTHQIGSTYPYSTIEFAGADQSVITLNGSASYGNVILSGSGVKTLTNENINGNLSIQGTVTIAGLTPTYNSTSVLEYKGSVAQNTSNEFGGVGSNPGLVKIDNANGVTLTGPKMVNVGIQLINGYLTTTNTNSLTINNDAYSVSVNNTGFINGPLIKKKNTAGGADLPVGNLTGGLRMMQIYTETSTPATFRATFISADPRTVPNGTNLGDIAQISRCEYWDLTRTAGTTAAMVTLSWPAAANSCGAAYVGDISKLIVAHHNGTNWVNEGQHPGWSSGTASGGGKIFSLGYITSFSPFTLGTTDPSANPLPVMLADVKAFQKNSGIQIDWSNLTERDLIGYTVERSANAQNFTAIDQQAPRSNINNKESYSSYDANPLTGVNYYRIKALEISGKIIYSKVMKVDLSGKQQVISLYPNPVNGSQVTLSMNVKKGQYTVKVLNAAGQQVHIMKLVHQGGSITQVVDLPSTVKRGVYNMIVTGDNYRQSKIFVVQSE